MDLIIPIPIPYRYQTRFIPIPIPILPYQYRYRYRYWYRYWYDTDTDTWYRWNTKTWCQPKNSVSFDPLCPFSLLPGWDRVFFLRCYGEQSKLKRYNLKLLSTQFMDLIVTTPTPPHQKTQWAEIVELIAYINSISKNCFYFDFSSNYGRCQKHMLEILELRQARIDVT